MKKKLLFLPILLLGAAITFSACNEPVESCKEDEICATKTVTACCTDATCVYKFNGKEYPDTDAGLTQLSIDLGCGTTSVVIKSTNGGDPVIVKLQDLMNGVR